MSLPKSKIVNVELYVGGMSKNQNIKNPLKLSANESALGPSPNVLNIFKQKLDIKKYPDGNSEKLKHVISKTFNLDQSQIIIGAGSDEIISLICQSFISKSDEVIVAEQSFLMYRIYSQLNGAIVKYAKNIDNKFSVEETLKLVSKKTKIVFIANPNNPTGTYISEKEMIKLKVRAARFWKLSMNYDYTEEEDSRDDTVQDDRKFIELRTLVDNLRQMFVKQSVLAKSVRDILTKTCTVQVECKEHMQYIEGRMEKIDNYNELANAFNSKEG